MTFQTNMLILFLISYISFISSQSSNTSTNTSIEIDYCVGPLVHSSHKNPVNQRFVKYDPHLGECGLSCATGKQIYGLSSSQQDLVDFTTIIGTILCLIGLFILSINLYYDTKVSTEKFYKKPILFHIPYIITLSTFILTLLMSLSLLIGKDRILCLNNEFSYWNPIFGTSLPCTIFGILFYSSLLYYMFYVLLLSFIVWRQFKNPLNPLWHIGHRYWHLSLFIIVLILNCTAIGTSSIDPIEPMGVCFAGVADKSQLFGFVVLPMIISCVFSAFFLIYSGFLVRDNINRNKNTINKTATMKMVDLFIRILWYGFGVLGTLSLLFATGLKFYLKHDEIREGLKDWINCELNNVLITQIMGITNFEPVNCDQLRDNKGHKYKQSPFWFMSWIISCFMAILAQIILSFHSKARQRAAILKQKTLNKISTKLNSPKNSKNKNKIDAKMNTLEEIKSDESIDEMEINSPMTDTQTITITNNSHNNIGMTQIQSQTNTDSPKYSEHTISE